MVSDMPTDSFGRFFLAASSELRKLDALHKSPLFGLYSETSSGLDVVRAYKRTPQVSMRMSNETCTYVDLFTHQFMLSFLQKLDQAQLYYVLTCWSYLIHTPLYP